MQRTAATTLRRFDPATRRLEPVEWPETMRDVARTARHRDVGKIRLATAMPSSSARCRRRSGSPRPPLSCRRRSSCLASRSPASALAPAISYSLLVIDRDYVSRELLPTLAERHLGHQAEQGRAGGLDFKVAVVSRAAPSALVFQSTPSFAPALDAPADATADIFQVRTQDFPPLAAEVRRFTAFADAARRDSHRDGSLLDEGYDRFSTGVHRDSAIACGQRWCSKRRAA